MSKRVDSLSGQADKQEQYWRHNCLLLHGISENKNKKTDDLCFPTINEYLELSVTAAGIERTHWIGKPRDSAQKSRPISYNDRTYLREKKKRKGKDIKITDSLTATRMKKLKKAIEIYDFKMLRHLTGKFYLRMDQEIPVYFMINPDLVGTRQGLHYEKRNTFWVHVRLCLIKESEGLSFVFTFSAVTISSNEKAPLIF